MLKIKKHLSLIIYSPLSSAGGGRETWLNNFAPQIEKKNIFLSIDVHYISIPEAFQPPKIESISNKNINWICHNLPASNGRISAIARSINFIFKVFQHIKNKSVDGQHIVVAVGNLHEPIVTFLLKIFGKKNLVLVVWIRTILMKEMNARFSKPVITYASLVERITLYWTDLIISNGFDTKKYYESLLGRHVEAIPNAVDISKFSVIQRPAFSLPHITIAYIGRLSEEKGIRHYLDAIEIIHSQNCFGRLRFEIVGDGPLQYIIYDFCKKYPEAPVFYKGAMPNSKIAGYLNEIDAGVNLTYSNGANGGGGVSNALLELIASKRLTVAWDSMTYRQVLSDGQAIFVKEGDAFLLASAFKFINDNISKSEDIINSAYSCISEYSFESHIDKFTSYVTSRK